MELVFFSSRKYSINHIILTRLKMCDAVLDLFGGFHIIEY